MKTLYQITGLLALLQQCLGLTPPFLSKNVNTNLNMGGYDATIGADPSTPLQFFTLPGNTCPYAARTLITLHELDIPFETSEVKGRPTPDWYLNINPRGKVPAIRIPACDYEVIYESAICNEFLCDYSTTTLQKDNSLMPKDPIQRARIRLLNDHCDNVYAKTQFTFLMNKDETKDEEMAQQMEESLVAYEEALERSSGPFFLGENFTLADVHIIPFILRLIVTLRHWKNYELPKDKFPRLIAWYDVCSQRDSVKQAGISVEKIIEIYTMFVEGDYAFGGLNKNKK